MTLLLTMQKNRPFLPVTNRQKGRFFCEKEEYEVC